MKVPHNFIKPGSFALFCIRQDKIVVIHKWNIGHIRQGAATCVALAVSLVHCNEHGYNHEQCRDHAIVVGWFPKKFSTAYNQVNQEHYILNK